MGVFQAINLFERGYHCGVALVCWGGEGVGLGRGEAGMLPVALKELFQLQIVRCL